MSNTDWTWPKVRYELNEHGYTLDMVAEELGYSTTYVSSAQRRQCQPVQARIAAILNKAPKEIWPSRYEANGQIKRGWKSRQQNEVSKRRSMRLVQNFSVTG